MKQLPILIRREFWENRNMFLVLPALTTAFFILMMLLTLAGTESAIIDLSFDDDHHDVEFSSDGSGDHNLYDLAVMHLSTSNIDERSHYLNRGLQGLGTPLMVILWFVVIFYLLNSLYSDRRDRSILFWKSLPVSDAMTVVSKLLTALFLVPLVYVAGVAMMQLTALMLLTGATIGTDISAWDTVLKPASILSNWIEYLGVILFYSGWALPFFGWLVIVSAWAKSVPLIWAIGVPFGITIVEGIVTRQTNLSNWMGNHTLPAGFFEGPELIKDNMWSMAFSLQMVSALVVGGLLVAAAIWIRGKADEL